MADDLRKLKDLYCSEVIILFDDDDDDDGGGRMTTADQVSDDAPSSDSNHIIKMDEDALLATPANRQSLLKLVIDDDDDDDDDTDDTEEKEENARDAVEITNGSSKYPLFSAQDISKMMKNSRKVIKLFETGIVEFSKVSGQESTDGSVTESRNYRENSKKVSGNSMKGTVNNNGKAIGFYTNSVCADKKQNANKMPTAGSSKIEKNINKLPHNASAKDGISATQSPNYGVEGPSNVIQTIEKSNLPKSNQLSANDLENMNKSPNDVILGSQDNSKETIKLPHSSGYKTNKHACIIESSNGNSKNVMKSPNYRSGPSGISQNIKKAANEFITRDRRSIGKSPRHTIAGSSKDNKKNVIECPNDAESSKDSRNKNLSDDEMSRVSNVSGVVIDLSDDGMSGVSNVSGVDIDLSDDGMSGVSNVSGVDIDLSDDGMSGVSNVSGVDIDLSDDGMSETSTEVMSEASNTDLSGATSADDKAQTNTFELSGLSTVFEIISEEEEPGSLTTREILQCYEQAKLAMHVKCDSELVTKSSNSSLQMEENITRSSLKCAVEMPSETTGKPLSCRLPVSERTTINSSSGLITNTTNKESAKMLSSFRKENPSISDNRTACPQNRAQEFTSKSIKPLNSSRNVASQKHENTNSENTQQFTSEYEEPNGSPPVKRKIATISSCKNIESKLRKPKCGPLSFKIRQAKLSSENFRTDCNLSKNCAIPVNVKEPVVNLRLPVEEEMADGRKALPIEYKINTMPCSRKVSPQNHGLQGKWEHTMVTLQESPSTHNCCSQMATHGKSADDRTTSFYSKNLYSPSENATQQGNSEMEEEIITISDDENFKVTSNSKLPFKQGINEKTTDVARNRSLPIQQKLVTEPDYRRRHSSILENAILNLNNSSIKHKNREFSNKASSSQYARTKCNSQIKVLPHCGNELSSISNHLPTKTEVLACRSQSLSQNKTIGCNSTTRKQAIKEVLYVGNEPSKSLNVTAFNSSLVEHDLRLMSAWESEEEEEDKKAENVLASSLDGNHCVSADNDEFQRSVLCDQTSLKVGTKRTAAEGWIIVDRRAIVGGDKGPSRCRCFYQEAVRVPACQDVCQEHCILGEEERKARRQEVARWLTSNKPYVAMTVEEVASTHCVDHWDNPNVKVIGRLAMRGFPPSKRGRLACNHDEHDFLLLGEDEPSEVCVDFRLMQRRMPLVDQLVQAFCELRVTPYGEPLLMALIWRPLHLVDRPLLSAYRSALDKMKAFVPLFVNRQPRHDSDSDENNTDFSDNN